MPGFLSKYEGTVRIPIDDEYWVDVKKSLTYAEAADAEKAGMAFKMVPDMQHPEKSRTDVTIDPDAKAFEQVLASVVSWNLTDDNGELLPLDFDRDLEAAQRASVGGRGNSWKMPRRKSLERLPKSVYDILAREVGRANLAPTREEMKTFPAGNGSGLAVRADEAPDAPEVRSGEDVLAAPGDPGGPPAPA